MYRHQLYGSNAKLFQIFDTGSMSNTRVGPTYLFGYIRIEFSKALYMCLIYNGIVIADIRRLIAFPVKTGIDDDRFSHKRSTIRLAKAQIRIFVSNLIAK